VQTCTFIRIRPKAVTDAWACSFMELDSIGSRQGIRDPIVSRFAINKSIGHRAARPELVAGRVGSQTSCLKTRHGCALGRVKRSGCRVEKS
jgi:hypothetical protein